MYRGQKKINYAVLLPWEEKKLLDQKKNTNDVRSRKNKFIKIKNI